MTPNVHVCKHSSICFFIAIMEKSNREKIAILLCARVDVTTINTVRCSERKVYNVRRRGEDLERREGSGEEGGIWRGGRDLERREGSGEEGGIW